MSDEAPQDKLTGTIIGPKGLSVVFPLQDNDASRAAWLGQALGHRIRFNHATSAWHCWSAKSSSWRIDKVREAEHSVVEKAQAVAVVMAQTPGPEAEQSLKLVRKAYDMHRVESALEMLATEPDYNTDGQDWDTEPYLLGCANGVVDLRTGTLLAGMEPSESRVTKNTGVKFDPKATCPKFARHLRQITSGDEDLANFYLQWFGYSLFGRNWEQRFLILTGPGRNGKGAMTHAVRNAVGEYDAKASQGIYMKGRLGSARSSEARSDLMCLRGARLAVMSEPEGGQFNEELLKAHTGGDPIVARPLYGKEMMWEPTHTITFLTNQPPSVDDIGPAMAERVLVADFRERYEGAAANTKLYDELEAEAPGILNALVMSAARYWARRTAHGSGLVYPERVVKASKAYIDSNDPVGQALADSFVLERGAKTQARDLYRTYLDWHATSDDPNEAISQNAFGMLLSRRGFPRRRSKQGNIYLGIRPKSAVELADGLD